MAEQPWKAVATAGDRRLAIPPDKDLASGDKDLLGRVLLPDGTIAKEAPVWVLMTWIPFQIGRENEAGQPVNESDDDLPGTSGARSKTEGVMNTDDGREPLTKEIRLLVPIDKSAAHQRITYGVVLEPDTEDLQGDVMTAEDIDKAGKWAPGPNARWRKLDEPEKRPKEPQPVVFRREEEGGSVWFELVREDGQQANLGTNQLSGNRALWPFRELTGDWATPYVEPVPIEGPAIDAAYEAAMNGEQERALSLVAPLLDSGPLTAVADPRVPVDEEEALAFFQGLGPTDMPDEGPRSRVRKNIRLLVPIEKSEAPAKRVSYGVVLEPDTEDLQGDVMTAEDIEEAAYDWMERSQAGGHMHSETVDGAKVVESYIAPCDIPVETAEGPETIRKGSWVLGMRWPESIWKRITGGELTGYSVGGTGVRLAMEDVGKATLGRMGGPLAAGPDGYCVCPSCGHREAHDTGEPCTELTCPECGAAMGREEPEEVDKAVDLTAQDVSKFARQAFEQVLKAKWAPGPNAGWRRLDAGEDDEEDKKPRTYHSDEAGEVTVPEDDDSTPRPEDAERDEELRRTRSEARQKIRRTFEGDYLETDDVTVDCRYAVYAGGGKPKITEPGRYGVFPDAENTPGGSPKNLDSIIWTEPGESLGDLIRRLPNGNYILAS